MFGGFGMHQYMKGMHGNLPRIEVTEKDFIRMMVATGKTEDEAKAQAGFCKMLGSSVMIGEQMVSINDKPEKKPTKKKKKK